MIEWWFTNESMIDWAMNQYLQTLNGRIDDLVNADISGECMNDWVIDQ